MGEIPDLVNASLFSNLGTTEVRVMALAVHEGSVLKMENTTEWVWEHGKCDW